MLKLFDQRNNTERHLILLGMELSSQLYLKDVDVDFTGELLSSTIVNPSSANSMLPIFNPEEEGKAQDIESVLGKKTGQLKNLTLVDCNITGLSTILNSLGMASLE